MKKRISIILAAVGFFVPQLAQAQGTLYLSNLGETPAGSAAVGSDAWIAQVFFTGTNSSGYNVNSLQPLMNPASGSPSGFAISFYSKTGDPHSLSSSDSPQSSLGSLTGSDPAAGGIFTYTASSITLSPSTFYFVVVTAATPVAQGSYSWSAANNTIIQSPNDRWKLDDVYYSSTDGSSWAFRPRQGIFQLALYATPVPEPATYALVGLGLVCLSYWRRNLR